MPKKKDNKKKANPILDDENEIEETDEQTKTDTDVEETDVEEVEEKPKGKTGSKSKSKAQAEEVDEDEVEERPLIERDVVKPRSDNRIEAQLKADASAVKATLSKEAKVRIYVPLGAGEKKGAHAYETVTINGYRMVLMKGEYSTVPQSVANMIEKHYNMTPEDTQAGQAFRLDRNRTKDDGQTTDDALLN